MSLIKFNIDAVTNSRCRDCWEVFLNSLKKEFVEFAMYTQDEFFFNEPQPRYDEETDTDLPAITEADVQSWVNEFECQTAQESLYEEGIDFSIDAIVRMVDPTIQENLERDQLWVNKKTGDIFTCIDSTPDKNIWVGTKSGKLIRPIPPADKIDFFSDGSTVAFFELYKDAKDLTGRYPGKEYRIKWEPLFDKSVATSDNNGTIKIKKLPFDSNTETVVVASWVYWNGTNSVMPYGWSSYDLYCSNGTLGFNTSQGDIHGIDFTPYKKQWVYMITVFKKGTLGKIFINGAEQTLNKDHGNFSATNAHMIDQFTIFGWKNGSGYRRFGKVGRLRLLNRELTPQEVGALTMAEVEFIKSIGGTI